MREKFRGISLPIEAERELASVSMSSDYRRKMPQVICMTIRKQPPCSRVRLPYLAALAALFLVPNARAEEPRVAADWASTNHYRLLLDVGAKGTRKRSNSPASVDIDFQRILSSRGVPGKFDESTIEVVALERPTSTRAVSPPPPPRQVPSRIDPFFGGTT